jgi:hypothetical protein
MQLPFAFVLKMTKPGKIGGVAAVASVDSVHAKITVVSLFQGLFHKA